MQHLTGDSHNKYYNQEYVDPTTNSERLPARPRDRSGLKKTYARWCCGSILGVIAWIVVVFLLITVPIVAVALKDMVSATPRAALSMVILRKQAPRFEYAKQLTCIHEYRTTDMPLPAPRIPQQR